MSLDSFDPFLHKEAPFFDTTAEAITAEAEALIKKTTDLCHDMLNQITPGNATFDNTIRPFADDENSRSTKENHLRFYASTHPVKEIREASYAVTELFNNAEAEFFSRTELFALVDSVMQQQRRQATLDDESMYYLTKFHQRFLMNGCGISDAESRDDFVTKTKRIAELAKQCRKNMANEKTGVCFNREELKGMPNTYIGQLTEGDGEHTGQLWVPTKTPFSGPIYNFAEEEATRKKMYYAVANRIPENIPLHRELVLLRDETARLLDWPNHFTFKTSQKMVKTPATVQKLLSEVRTALTPAAKQSVEELLALKIEEAIANGASTTDDIQLFLWDRAYFNAKAGQKKGITEFPVSEYFELNTTLRKLLDTYVHIFGVKLVPVDTSSDRKLVWHEDVQMFSAWMIDQPEEPEFLGYAYFDLYPREGKYTHAGHYTFQRRFQKPDGTWFHPCSCLVMNYMKPSVEKPTLLDLYDVRSLFHELGHMYHNILSRSRYARLHSVDGDFIETPSQMLEQFFWDPKIIRDVSFHYSYINPGTRKAWLSTEKGDKGLSPPRQISLELAAKLSTNEARERVEGSLSNLAFATYDMLVHSPTSHSCLEKTNLPELFNRTRCDIFQTPGDENWEYGQGQSVFRAIQGKYDAGYYAYILGRMFAIDIFETGFKGDVMNKENGRRWRDLVLSKGGSQPEMKTLTEYLGHEPSSRPYLEWLGVKGEEGGQRFG